MDWVAHQGTKRVDIFEAGTSLTLEKHRPTSLATMPISKSHETRVSGRKTISGAQVELSCAEPLLIVIIKGCRPLPGTCAKNPVKSKCVSIWNLAVMERVRKEYI